MSNILNNVSEKAEDLAKKSKETISKSQSEIKKSGKDWANYIEEHPIQSMLFGVVIYFAIKGFLKN